MVLNIKSSFIRTQDWTFAKIFVKRTQNFKYMFLKIHIFSDCIGFICQGFISRNTAGVALGGSDQGLPPHQRESVPDSFQPDLPLPKLNSSPTLVGSLLITSLQKGNTPAALRVSSRRTGSEMTLKSRRSVKEQEEVLHVNHEIAAFGEHHSHVNCFSLEAHERLR